MNTEKKLEYAFGHSQREIQRLISQAAMLRPVTERLLREVKIGPGMRVLDLGCGAGDVSMLAAEHGLKRKDGTMNTQISAWPLSRQRRLIHSESKAAAG